MSEAQTPGGDEEVQFPQEFVWGAATAAYQIEGGVGEGGRGPSIWDTFCRMPGVVRHGDTGDVACDHYHRFREDVAIMADLGLSGYRFSISWPRIQPLGRGPANPEGVRFYQALIDELRRAGIRPYVTLYHWDLPQVLQDEGGWTSRDTASLFADYATLVALSLEGVSTWITINEPWVAAHEGYSIGTHAPGGTSLQSGMRAAHHLLLAHGLAARGVRNTQPGAEIGISLNIQPVLPDSPALEDVRAAEVVEEFNNDWFLLPVLGKGYPARLRGLLEGSGKLTCVQEGDEDLIGAPIDFLGLNYYTRGRVRAGQSEKDSEIGRVLDAHSVERHDLPATAKGWPIDPDGLERVLLDVAARAPGVPIFVTENGASEADYVDPGGEIKDVERVEYLRSHLAAMWRAAKAGAPVRGYFCWSLLDNFEWDDGYSQRFGLVWVDYPTGSRTLKSSAKWYRRVARTGKIE